MNITQSAVSKQLAQLRDWLGDDLFVRTREGMQPTPRALALQHQVDSILSATAGLFGDDEVRPNEFDGPFVISATDEVLDRLVQPLVDHFADHAPRMRLVTLPLVRDYLVRQLESGQVNLVVAVNWRSPELLKQKRLGEDHFVCVMHRDHPLASVNLTVKRYVAAEHVLVAPLGSESGVVDIELGRLGMSRQVSVSVSAFHLVNASLLGDSRIVTLPSRVAERLAQHSDLVIRPVPLSLPTTDYFALWHPRFGSDPRFRWVMECVERVMSDE